MAEIRPAASGLPNAANAQSRTADPARSAAQRAFFQTALGKTGALPAEPAKPAPAPAPVQALVKTAQPAAPAMQTRPAIDIADPAAAQRYLRPGSLLDIKI